MSLSSHFRMLVLVGLTLTVAGVAAAQGPVVDSNTTTSELAMSATVQTAVQLNISSSSTVSTTVPATVATGRASGVAFERWVGLFISNSEAAGAKTATLIYTITVE